MSTCRIWYGIRHKMVKWRRKNNVSRILLLLDMKSVQPRKSWLLCKRVWIFPKPSVLHKDPNSPTTTPLLWNKQPVLLSAPATPRLSLEKKQLLSRDPTFQ
ncbi:uncharacterized protein ACOB8E_006810 isoform 2-T2 [Sarcophilus harrisii]